MLLDLAPGTQLSGEQVQAVVHLVSSSVEDMDPDQVTVADSTGKVLSAAGDGVSRAAGDARSQVEQEYEARLAANAQKILDRVVGPGHAVVSVRADLDFSQRDTTPRRYTYDPGTPPLSESTTTENYNGTGAPVGGVLGPENIPTRRQRRRRRLHVRQGARRPPTTPSARPPRTMQGAPGAVNRLTVSVVMDDGRPATSTASRSRTLVSNAVGLDTARGDAITVATMAFDTTAADAGRRRPEGRRGRREERADVVDGQDRRHRRGHRAARARRLAALPRAPGGVEERGYELLEPLSESMLRRALDRLPASSSGPREQVRGRDPRDGAARPDEVATKLRGGFADRWSSERPAEVAALLARLADARTSRERACESRDQRRTQDERGVEQ